MKRLPLTETALDLGGILFLAHLGAANFGLVLY
jgi:hypothetical protein